MDHAPLSLKKKGYHHNDLRNALLKIALQMTIERNGPHFSLRELTAMLGVTHASVYRHFSDKAALLDALVAQGFRELLRYQAAEQMKASQDSLSQLYALNEAYICFAQENRGYFSLMFGNRIEKETEASEREEHNAEALATLINAIVRCQKDGIIIAGDPERIAGYLVMGPHGFACYSSQERSFVCDAQDVMQPRALAEIGLIPLLTNPPVPDEIAARFFASRRNREAD